MRLKVPKTAKHGDVVELKVLIQHPMESGYRRDSQGEAVPRNILKRFECFYGQDIIMSGEFGPGIAANPILTFYARATKAATIRFRWTEQTGREFEDAAQLNVI